MALGVDTHHYCGRVNVRMGTGEAQECLPLEYLTRSAQAASSSCRIDHR
jgi:hypothetical protein